MSYKRKGSKLELEVRDQDVEKLTDKSKSEEKDTGREKAKSEEIERKTRLDCVFVSQSFPLPWQLIGASLYLIIIHLCGFVYNVPSSESRVREREQTGTKR